jgi:AraC-like DNA-binding protein
MNPALTTAIDRFTRAHADANGIARTRIPGMTLLRVAGTRDVKYAIERPLICLVAQGAKHVTMGETSFSVGAGDSMIVSSNHPTLTRIIDAKQSEPYLSFSLRLDPSLIADCMAEMNAARCLAHAATPQDTDNEVADVALRMISLHDRPASLAPLQASLVREMHHWLLVGRHGEAIAHLGFPDSHTARIARAIEVIRAEFATAISIERLAGVAGMSASTFHHHFRAQTSLSPIQFQKQLRLIQARRLMLSKGQTSSAAAFAVGYASVQQFTRDYRRLFDLPPVRETEKARRAFQSEN